MEIFAFEDSYNTFQGNAAEKLNALQRSSRRGGPPAQREDP